MSEYLLSVHSVEGQQRPPMTEAQMMESMQKIGALEEDMKSAGAWLFSGRLHEADTATVVRMDGDEALMTDGPFAESKEHLAGFYIITADDLDGALEWATKTTAIIGAPIEVRPFAGFAS